MRTAREAADAARRRGSAAHELRAAVQNELARQTGVVARLDDPLDAATRAYERGRQQGLERGVDQAVTISQLLDLNLADLDIVESRHDELDGQIDRLAQFILAEIDGEPSEPEGAIDTAIRLLSDYRARIAQLLSERTESDRVLAQLRTTNDTLARQMGSVDREGIKRALEGDSNDDEHDALVGVAEALGIEYGNDDDDDGDDDDLPLAG